MRTKNILCAALFKVLEPRGAPDLNFIDFHGFFMIFDGFRCHFPLFLDQCMLNFPTAYLFLSYSLYNMCILLVIS